VSPRARPRPLPPAKRPAVVAHRGASSAVAEHTLASFVSAIESGADALECDVRMTRDGHLVCVHDRTVNRTSDGTGVVSDLDLPGLQALDFSSWHVELPESADQLLGDSPYAPYLSGVVPDRISPTGGVLTLETLLGLVRDAARPVRLLIETKHPTRYQGLVEKELVATLARFGWAGRGDVDPAAALRQPADLDNRVAVMSFAPTALRRIKLLAPAIPTVLLLDRLPPLRRDAVLPAGVPIAGPGLQVLRVNPGYVSRAHARGYPVLVWTVDEPDDVRFVVDLGVDTVVTNRPAEVLALLGPAA
jgi:glycerophosphoryl diester phosphodiesterase